MEKELNKAAMSEEEENLAEFNEFDDFNEFSGEEDDIEWGDMDTEDWDEDDLDFGDEDFDFEENDDFIDPLDMEDDIDDMIDENLADEQ